jgi:DNA-binding transcriptional MerR regulator
VLKIVKRLLDAGVSLQNIRTAVDHLRNRGVVELERKLAQTLPKAAASVSGTGSARGR